MTSSLRRVLIIAVLVPRCRTSLNLNPHFSSSPDPWLSSQGNTLLPWPPRNPPSPSAANPHSIALTAPTVAAAAPTGTATGPAPGVDEALDFNQASLESDATAVVCVLTGPLSGSTDLDAALFATGLRPSPSLLQAILRVSELSPASALALYRWARCRPGFRLTPPLLASLVDLLGKCRSFDDAWSVLLADGFGENPVSPADAFGALIRRYARAGMPQAAIRTYEYMRNSCPLPLPCISPDNADTLATDPLDLLVDALCKEGHTRAAAEYIDQRKMDEPDWSPTIRTYNILLNGWFRSRRLRKAEQVWCEIRRQSGIRPTVVTYGTMIEGLCRMRRVEQAIELVEEMRLAAIQPNEITCNPIVDALAEAGRFKEALGAVEKFPLYGISPNISTYNSLVKGFCKNSDLVGASKVLKDMIGRGILPTATTYNYFFRYFARSSKIEEGMTLYTKMIQSGYAPDRLTYQLLIKMLCEGKQPELAAMLIREMRERGLDSDLATGTMLVHMLCRMRRFEEACEELEGMVKRGIVPQYLTRRMLVGGLRRVGRPEMAGKVEELMRSMPHSEKLPNTFMEEGGAAAAGRKKAVMRKAKAMAEALKKGGAGAKRWPAEEADKLTSLIKQRVFAAFER